MERPRVTLREMTAAEYRSYVEEVQAAVVRELLATMPEEEARATAAGGIAKYLPEGVATPHHTLLIAEDAAGAAVGNAWVGPDPHRAEGSDAAWLYDINVYPQARRRGYGSAILAEVEALVAREGKARLGLNVVGTNAAAIALYRKSGYAVTTQQMSKPLSRAVAESAG
jgi:ribosomal protein S18 acetylase RimI-like enzyme